MAEQRNARLACRCDRYADRSRYLAAHIAQRLILSRCLDVDADQIQFSCNQFGKPHVLGGTIGFSLSHSAEMILVEVTADRSVGIDVEHICTDFDYELIVKMQQR